MGPSSGAGAPGLCWGGGQQWRDQEGGRARSYPGRNEPGCRGHNHPGWGLHPLGLGAAGSGWLLLGRGPLCPAYSCRLSLAV